LLIWMLKNRVKKMKACQGFHWDAFRVSTFISIASNGYGPMETSI